MSVLKTIIALFIFHFSYAADKCEFLFDSTAESSSHSVEIERHIEQWLYPLEKALSVAAPELKTVDQCLAVESQFRISIQHLIDSPELLNHIDEIREKFSKITQQEPGRTHTAKAKFAREVVSILGLIHADIEVWKKFVFDYLVEVEKNGTSGYDLSSPNSTLGYLMQKLPAEKKTQLVQYLGSLYLGPLKRMVSKPIHVILDPKSIYLQFKKERKSDRDFYRYYIQLLNQTAFAGTTEVGGYSADVVIDLALEMQKYLQQKKDMQAINFFGSVPNGFGTSASDIDAFNHPDPKNYPHLAQQIQEASENYKIPDPLEPFRYQIDDPILKAKIEPLLKKYKVHWDLKSAPNARTHEHFFSIAHIFSFRITADRIVLRFYANYMNMDESGQRLEPWDFIELDVTH